MEIANFPQALIDNSSQPWVSPVNRIGLFDPTMGPTRQDFEQHILVSPTLPYGYPFPPAWDAPSSPHPFESELEQICPDPASWFPPTKEIPLMDQTAFHWVNTVEKLVQTIGALKKEKVIAIDVEYYTNSFFGQICLCQISTWTDDFVIDCIELLDHMHLLNQVTMDKRVTKVFHDAYCDVQWLQQHAGVYVISILDTFIGAHVLGLAGKSLLSLVDEFCGVHLDKSKATEDWRLRPLPDDMLMYARADTHYLLYVAHGIKLELSDSGSSIDALIAPLADLSIDDDPNYCPSIPLPLSSRMPRAAKKKRVYSDHPWSSVKNRDFSSADSTEVRLFGKPGMVDLKELGSWINLSHQLSFLVYEKPLSCWDALPQLLDNFSNDPISRMLFSVLLIWRDNIARMLNYCPELVFALDDVKAVATGNFFNPKDIISRLVPYGSDPDVEQFIPLLLQSVSNLRDFIKQNEKWDELSPSLPNNIHTLMEMIPNNIKDIEIELQDDPLESQPQVTVSSDSSNQDKPLKRLLKSNNHRILSASARNNLFAYASAIQSRILVDAFHEIIGNRLQHEGVGGKLSAISSGDQISRLTAMVEVSCPVPKEEIILLKGFEKQVDGKCHLFLAPAKVQELTEYPSHAKRTDPALNSVVLFHLKADSFLGKDISSQMQNDNTRSVGESFDSGFRIGETIDLSVMPSLEIQKKALRIAQNLSQRNIQHAALQCTNLVAQASKIPSLTETYRASLSILNYEKPLDRIKTILKARKDALLKSDATSMVDTLDVAKLNNFFQTVASTGCLPSFSVPPRTTTLSTSSSGEFSEQYLEELSETSQSPSLIPQPVHVTSIPLNSKRATVRLPLPNVLTPISGRIVMITESTIAVILPIPYKMALEWFDPTCQVSQAPKILPSIEKEPSQYPYSHQEAISSKSETVYWRMDRGFCSVATERQLASAEQILSRSPILETIQHIIFRPTHFNIIDPSSLPCFAARVLAFAGLQQSIPSNTPVLADIKAQAIEATLNDTLSPVMAKKIPATINPTTVQHLILLISNGVSDIATLHWKYKMTKAQVHSLVTNLIPYTRAPSDVQCLVLGKDVWLSPSLYLCIQQLFVRSYSQLMQRTRFFNFSFSSFMVSPGSVYDDKVKCSKDAEDYFSANTDPSSKRSVVSTASWPSYHDRSLHVQSLFSPISSGELSRIPDFLTTLPSRLNASQEKAVVQALHHSVSLIQGPPGTGKTQCVSQLIAIWLGAIGTDVTNTKTLDGITMTRDNMMKLRFGRGPVLASAFSNVAVDQIILRLMTLPGFSLDCSPEFRQWEERNKTWIKEVTRFPNYKGPYYRIVRIGREEKMNPLTKLLTPTETARRMMGAVGDNSQKKVDKALADYKSLLYQLRQKKSNGSEPTADEVKKLTAAYDLHFQLSSAREGDLYEMSARMAQSACVIGATCIASKSHILKDMSFNLVIVDECTQSAEEAIICPITKLAPTPNDFHGNFLLPKSKSPKYSSLSNNYFSRVVLVGDQCQLPPVIVNDILSLAGMDISLFDRLLRTRYIPKMALQEVYKNENREAPRENVPPAVLRTQYRMHPSISLCPNLVFYQGYITDGTPPAARPMISKLPLWPSLNFTPLVYSTEAKKLRDNSSTGTSPLDLKVRQDQLKGFEVFHQKKSQFAFIDCKGEESTPPNSFSWINVDQAKVIIKIVTKLLGSGSRKQGVPVFKETLESYSSKEELLAEINKKKSFDFELTEQDIGIITPYSGQRFNIKRELARFGFSNIEVNTIDGFQGREKELIIFSTVRSNKMKNIGFLKSAQRTNVALTRAKRGCIVVGHAKTLNSSPIWQELIAKWTASKMMINDTSF